jgi:tRNA threonylcarbamoyl adenosine modification protein YeaZ
LVIDTATPMLSVALFEESILLARHHELVGRGHAEKLMPAVAALPGGGRADHIAVDVGPGSFTGVRIGLAAARALAFAWNVPLSGYSATASIAAGARARSEAPETVAVAITGGHGEIFWQCFAGNGLSALGPLESVPIAALAAREKYPIIYGSGAEALVTARHFGTAVSLHPDSADYPVLRGLAPLPPTPLYGRGADAKPMASAT